MGEIISLSPKIIELIGFNFFSKPLISTIFFSIIGSQNTVYQSLIDKKNDKKITLTKRAIKIDEFHINIVKIKNCSYSNQMVL